jgi:hypothetical protein
MERFTTVPDAPDTDPEVVCAERRFRQHRKPTVLHEKNAD